MRETAIGRGLFLVALVEEPSSAAGASSSSAVRGTSMSGTWTSPEGGGSWTARKVS